MPRCFNCGRKILFKCFGDGGVRAIEENATGIEVHSCPRPQALPPKFTPAEQNFLILHNCMRCGLQINRIPKRSRDPFDDDYFDVQPTPLGLIHHDCQDLFCGHDRPVAQYLKANPNRQLRLTPIHCVLRLPGNEGGWIALISIINHYDKSVIIDRYFTPTMGAPEPVMVAGDLVLFNSDDAQTIISISSDGHLHEWQRERGDRTIVVNNLYLNGVFGHAPDHRTSITQAPYVFC